MIRSVYRSGPRLRSILHIRTFFKRYNIFMHEKHNIDPVYDKDSKILILGSFPSVKSREAVFYYAHPQNRFWRIMENLFGIPHLETIEDKKAFLLSHHIALWDVIGECTITGSSDSSIRDVVPNNLDRILESGNIKAVFTNGKKSDSLYRKYQEKTTGIEAICLPSSSPANAAWNMERLLEEWKTIQNYL